MTALDWPELRALVDAGAVGRVLAAMDGLDDRQRRALAAPVRAYARTLRAAVEVGWRERARRAAALRVAGAGCLSGADTVARWLTRQDLWTFPDDLTTTELVRLLQARDVPWLAELARRLADRLRADRWDDQLWRLVAGLFAAAGMDADELPTGDGVVLGWMRTPRPGRRLADGLAADPYLGVLAPRLFEVDGAGWILTWSAGRPEASWPLALAALAADGRLPRTMLMDRCLGRLLRGGRPGELRGFLLLHEALDPGLDEVAPRARDYARLLADGPSAVAVTAQRALRRLDDAGRLEPGLLAEASRAVLFRPEKALVRTQLSWLDAVARRRPDRADELLGAVSVAFAQEAAELQSRALALLVRHARHAGQETRAGLLEAAAALPADLRQQAAAALGGPAPADPSPPWPVLAAPAPRALPPPIGSPAELAEELATHLQGDPAVEPVTLERLLAALVAFAHRDRSALANALEPVLARHRLPLWIPAVGPTSHHAYLNEYALLSWVVLAAVTPPARGRMLLGPMEAAWAGGPQRLHHPARVGPGPRLAMLCRLREIAAGLGRPPPLLLATPTSVTGHLDPAVLLSRLRRAAADGWRPWEYDLQQALLRLPRGPDPAVLADARRLATPAGRRLAAWLAGGWPQDPEVSRVVRAARPAPRWGLGVYHPATDGRVRALATVTPGADPGRPRPASAPAGIVRRVLPRRLSLAALLDELPEPERWRPWDLGHWLACWPAVAPSHRDQIAAHLLPRLADLPVGGRGDGRVLPLLAEADGPAGPGMALALAYGLGARDPGDRAAAVDALLLLAGRRQLDGPALGTELAALATLDLLRLGRVVPGLRDAARSGAAADVWAILAAAIPGMLPPARERPPRGLPDLIALGAEVAGVVGGCRAIPELAAVVGPGGSSRLATESRRLQRLLKGSQIGQLPVR